MLNSIEIRNFKAIKDEEVTVGAGFNPPDPNDDNYDQKDGRYFKKKPLILNKLAGVNYLVGENGCGKSSVLEGIWVFFNYPHAYKEKMEKLYGYDNHDLTEKIEELEIIYPTREDPIEKIPLQDAAGIITDWMGESETDISIKYNKKEYSYNKNTDKDNYLIDWTKESCSFFSKYYTYKYKFDLTYFYTQNDIEEILRTLEKFNIVKNLGINIKIQKFYEKNKYTRTSDNRIYCLAFLSQGERYLLYLILSINYYAEQFKREILLLDEPEVGLHPKWQKLLPQIFAEFPNLQFIISTHSPFIISEASKYDNQKVYLIKEGQTVDIFGKLGEGKNGYEDANCILAVNKMLGAGLSDFLPSKIFFCENSLAEFIKAFCKKHNTEVKPICVTGGGDTNSLNRGAVFKDIKEKFNQFHSDRILNTEYKIIIDNNQEITKKIKKIEKEYEGLVIKLDAQDQETLFYKTKPKEFEDFLRKSELPEKWDIKKDKTFTKFLSDNQCENQGKIKSKLAEIMGECFSKEELKKFSKELHDFIFRKII
jgi:predicted ATPase